jgi:c-di-GMP-binding flagellar brake protein YcgR
MDNDDSAMLHNKAMILNNLSLLMKNKCMISADLGGKESVLTAIIAVNHKENAIILDYGSSEHLNKRLLTHSHVKFSTVFNGIQVAFNADKVTKVKYQREDAFQIPIPNSLYWYNRREYYRVNVPIMNPGICEVTLKEPDEEASLEQKQAYKNAVGLIREGLMAQIQADLVAEQQEFMKAYNKMSVESKIKAKLERQKIEEERAENPPQPEERLLNLIRLNMHDISLSGFSMKNFHEEFSFFLTRGIVYEKVNLVMPSFGTVEIGFEIMMKRQIETHKIGEFAELVGVKFLPMRQGAESTVLRYIQEIERQSGVLNN